MSGSVPVVTAVRDRGRRVAIELDGAHWRVVPLDCAVAAQIRPGVTLNRERAVILNRALRAHAATVVASRALRHADHTRATLEHRLAARGIAEPERRDVVARLECAGLVDDERLARERGATLARRGLGNAGIHADLERRGIASTTIAAVLASLAPESERAAAVVAIRGRSSSTARLLASRGFDEDAVALAFPDGAEL